MTPDEYYQITYKEKLERLQLNNTTAPMAQAWVDSLEAQDVSNFTDLQLAGHRANRDAYEAFLKQLKTLQLLDS